MKYSILKVVALSLVLFSCQEAKKAASSTKVEPITKQVESQIVENRQKQENTLTLEDNKVSRAVITETATSVTEKSQAVVNAKKVKDSSGEMAEAKESDMRVVESRLVESKAPKTTLPDPVVTETIASGKTQTDNIIAPATAPKTSEDQKIEAVQVTPRQTEEEVAQPAKDSKTEVQKGQKSPSSKTTLPLSHDLFDELLKKHVSVDGKVNYNGFISDMGKLDEYLSRLTEAKVADFSRNEQLAFWINAYNAYTIKFVTDNWPVSKITDLEGGKPWDKKWIKLDGRTLSLNNIENDIIRPQFNEPRIHFAVNCAAKSCPPLMNKAWTSSSLKRDLKARAKAFINNPTYNQISSETLSISKIFEWYAKDFGDIKTYISQFSTTEIAKAELKYMEYDWSLNN